MKFLEKVKNMFTEEVEEEVKPIKSEVRKIEIPAPVKKQETEVVNEESGISENETINKDEKFKFPVYFDDKDFDKLPSAVVEEKKSEPVKKVETIAKKVSVEPIRKEAYGGKNPAASASIVKEEKKIFKPTPIISPVYGVLDKNYKKEDITPRKRVEETRVSRGLTVDDIRNKAYGTLEDDLETTLFGKDSIMSTYEPEEDNFELFDEFDDIEVPKHVSEEYTLPSRVEKNRELDFMAEVDDLEDLIINERPTIDELTESEEYIEDSYTNMIEDEMDKICSEPIEEEPELTGSDLFNLIDSMYEKKDGEEE